MQFHHVALLQEENVWESKLILETLYDVHAVDEDENE